MIRETHFIITIVVLIVYISSDCEGAPALNPLRPCETTSVLPFIKSNVVRLIPNYNSELLMIQLSGEAKPSFYIAERGLGDFLSSYYKLAKSSLARCLIEDERLRNPMLMTFNLLYLKFLDRVGIRLSCLSYYAGFSQFSSVNQLVLLANNLQKRLRMDNREYTKGKLPPAVLWNPTPVDPGRNLATKLGLNFVPPFAEDFVDLDNTVRPGSPVCNEMFIKLRDSQLVTAFPSYVIQPLTLHIPGDPMQIVDTQSSNATHHLSRYMSSGLKCLDSNLLRKNFSLSLSNWISNKLIPPLVDSTHCIKGFPGIFVLMQSIEAYGNHIEVTDGAPTSSAQASLLIGRKQEIVPPQEHSELYRIDAAFLKPYSLPQPLTTPQPPPPLQQAPQIHYIQVLPIQPPPPLPPAVPAFRDRFRELFSDEYESATPIDEDNDDGQETYGYSPDFNWLPLKRPPPPITTQPPPPPTTTAITETRVEGEVITGAATGGVILVLILLILFGCCAFCFYYTHTGMTMDELRRRLRDFSRPFKKRLGPTYDSTVLIGKPPKPRINEKYEHEPPPRKPTKRKERDRTIRIIKGDNLGYMKVKVTDVEDDEEVSDEPGVPEDIEILTTPKKKLRGKQRGRHAIYSTTSLTPSSSLEDSEDEESDVIYERYSGRPSTDLTPSGKKNLRRAQDLSFERANRAADRAAAISAMSPAAKSELNPIAETNQSRNTRRTSNPRADSTEENYFETHMREWH